MNNLSSYCGLVDAKIRASDKDLPVLSGLNLGLLEAKEKVLPMSHLVASAQRFVFCFEILKYEIHS